VLNHPLELVRFATLRSRGLEMPFKRPSPTRESSESSSNTVPPLKRLRSCSSSQDQAPSNSRITPVTVYIVQSKLDPELLSDLFRIAERDQIFTGTSDSNHEGVKFDLCHDVGEAEVVVTAVHMRRRLERHVDWEIVVRSWFLGQSYRTPDGLYSERKGDSYTSMASGLGSARQTDALW
jgi:hypothetical protein